MLKGTNYLEFNSITFEKIKISTNVFNYSLINLIGTVGLKCKKLYLN